MNYADFISQPNGFPLESDSTLGFMQADYQSAIKAVARLAGGNGVILTGLIVTAGTASDGWILYDGDVIFFQGGTVSTYFIITQNVQQKANENGLMVDRYFTKKAQFGVGSGQVAFSSLKRIDSIEDLMAKLSQIVSFDPAVILEGCAVTNVAGGSCDISAGTIVIDGKFIDTDAYSGNYPVYVPPDGVYTTSEPVSGNYITFDPYTSQRYGDVLRRQVFREGQVIIQKTTTDRFDSNGVGRWEMKGFQLLNGYNSEADWRGRFPVMFDNRTSDPSNGIWDALYNTPGNTGGEKAHALTIDEMPSHNHTENTVAGTDVDPGEYGLIRKSVSGENRTTNTTDTSQSGVEPDIVTSPRDIPYQGENDAHENRPPFVVVVFAIRTAD